MILVSHTQEPDYEQMSIAALEKHFSIDYLPHLTFANWEVEQFAKRKCRRALKRDRIGSCALWLGAFHKQEFENPQIKDVAIRFIDKEMGYGLFSTKPIKKWELVGEYAGLLRHRSLFFPNINDYCFMYPREWFTLKPLTIDSERQGNYTRFINHSDTPNLESLSIFYEGIFRIIFRAIEDIPAGMELTYDYGDIYWRRRKKRQVCS